MVLEPPIAASSPFDYIVDWVSAAVDVLLRRESSLCCLLVLLLSLSSSYDRVVQSGGCMIRTVPRR